MPACKFLGIQKPNLNTRSLNKRGQKSRTKVPFPEIPVKKSTSSFLCIAYYVELQVHFHRLFTHSCATCWTSHCGKIWNGICTSKDFKCCCAFAPHRMSQYLSWICMEHHIRTEILVFSLNVGLWFWAFKLSWHSGDQHYEYISNGRGTFSSTNW